MYSRIKAKHLVFGESREEREVRVDGEHAALSKGRLTGHQFEPLFEASIAELEAVGLGKMPRELYLSYLRKMPSHLQKEIRADKRLWPTGETPVLRAPRTWEESHKVVLEFEQREAAHKAVANAVYTASSSSADPHAGELADTKKELAKLKAEVKAAAKAAAKANANQTLAATTKGKGKGSDAERKICFHFRDHGNCPKGDSCPYSHDKKLRKRALTARREAGHQQTLATTKGGGKAGGKGGGKTGKPKAKAKAKAKAKSNKAGAKPPGTVCPFFAKNGLCRKGANCDMVHSLATSIGSQLALPSNWGTALWGASMSNPVAAFSIQIGSVGVQTGVPAADAKGAGSLAGGTPVAGSLPLQRSKGEKILCGRAACRLVAPRRERGRRLPVPHGRPSPRQEGRDDAGRLCRREPHYRRASHGHAQPGG